LIEEAFECGTGGTELYDDPHTMRPTTFY